MAETAAPAVGRAALVRSAGVAWRLGLLGFGFAAGFLLVLEARTSTLQAAWLVPVAREADWTVEPGPAPGVRFPSAGPYDERLGYTRIPAFTDALGARGFRIEGQARPSPPLARLVELGLYPPYREKAQAGLRIEDRLGTLLYEARNPPRVYDSFEAIPPVLVRTLLYVENRELLDERYPSRNPAVEWDRLALAGLRYAAGLADSDVSVPGGSTLATQMEKFRHSAGGRTDGPLDKLRQVASASLRAYRSGRDTRVARRRLVTDYLNSLPLAAAPGVGEVNGLAEGLRVWFGADFDAVNRALRRPVGAPGSAELAEQGRAYAQVLALLLAVQRPSDYLLRDRAALERRMVRFLPVLAVDGVIAPRLADAAGALASALREQRPPAPDLRPPADWKAANPVRARLVSLLGLADFYELDRLDLAVASSLDGAAQSRAQRFLRSLRDPEQVAAAGLAQFRMLDRGDPANVVYSLSLYERGPGTNWLLVQTDSSDRAFDVNEQVKLDLGSTAKLRTLVTYLEAVAAVYEQHRGEPPAALRAVEVDPADRLTRWVLDRQIAEPRLELPALLEAALERRYSASPGERFFTGGGLHHFANFDSDHDRRVLSVREAFRDSVNLPFVRLMREVVHHYMFRVPGSTATILRDRSDPQRIEYLRRFADREGRIFLARFHAKYRGKPPEQAVELLLAGVSASPRRIATALRSVEPDADLAAFSARLRERLPGSALSDSELARLYESYAPQRFDLADRGYLAGVHPLELWLVAYLREHPGASLAAVQEASAEERIGVYRWLFRTRRKNAQDRRIRSLLELEAFVEIHDQWRRLGYPFDSLVPSYATAIGSSADRPAALAELMGIVVSGGVRQPTRRISRVAFAEGTPYETWLVPDGSAPERVLRPEVAAAVRGELVHVVERGTARRALGALASPEGQPLEIGGKTGTGDHRFKIFGPGGRLLESRAVARTATFAFLIGDRWYGVLTAYVGGEESAGYGFTSSLPVQIFKLLVPELGLVGAPPGSAEVARAARLGAVGAGAAAEEVRHVEPDAQAVPGAAAADSRRASDAGLHRRLLGPAGGAAPAAPRQRDEQA